MFHILEEDQVERLLDRKRAIDIIEQAYRASAKGMAAVSDPAAMHLRGHRDAGLVFKVKGAVLDEAGVVGWRIIGDFTEGHQVGRAYTYLADARTAEPRGLVSELFLHRVRTATTGLVTCRALLRREPARMALVGTGRIAEQFVRSLPLVFPHTAILLASRSPQRAHAAAADWGTWAKNPILPAGSIVEAVSGAEVVVTLCDADETLFHASDLRKPGVLVCAMGGRHEFDADVFKAADQFIVDELDFVCSAGNAAHWIKAGTITREEVTRRTNATIGQVLAGSYTPRAGDLCLAIIQGMAICDLSLANEVMTRAEGQE